ncbi:tryptophan halogenase [Pelomonas saccharophila]|uniref:Tryptophan halogenase n=1 Tax=Roseateles saccharophilus TaxID=304 RepID=A0ABU1YWC1_ROSSA|nr:tryptophan 7-halogenase [Roseateles saccharophilus]MDR7273154.1 tryptophan halogenase [Roseateles saccharophilus]
MKTRRIAIIGGGTAGWLAANHLGYELCADTEVVITVIESADVPIIGVGEGTVPALKTSLRKFGISEADLLVACDTTFKNGIKFQGWLDAAKHGKDHFYYHPFASPFPDGLDITPTWLEQPLRNFADVSISARVAEAGRSPKQISSPPYVGEVEYAYHVNAHKFAALLAENARKRFRVQYLVATVVDAERGEDGAITALRMASGEVVPFDFYIDCSGFSSLLAHQVLNVPFVDKSHQLLADTALVQQVPTNPADEIPPYTLALAHEAGWIWDIPVTHRRGTGFVYASAHMSESRALECYARYLGVNPDSLSPRKIPMRIGYRQQFWFQNCVSLGLAQGFVEPLEATSILVTDFSANLLSRNFPRFGEDAQALRRGYNEAVTTTWERVIDFVQLHYHLSDRSDSSFWLENRRSDHLSETLRERLARWAVRHPQKNDFTSRFDLFDVDNHLYVLYGMRFATRPMPISDFERRECLEQFEHVTRAAEQAIRNLPSHRDWLTGLRAAYQRP